MSGSDQQTTNKFAHFDAMRTDALRELLRQDSLTDTDEDHLEAILYISEVVAKRDKEENTNNIPDVNEAWQSFNQNYRPLLKSGVSLYGDDDDDHDDDDDGSFAGEMDRRDENNASAADGAPDTSSAEHTENITTEKKTHKRSSRVLLRAARFIAVLCVIIVVGSFTTQAFGINIWEKVAQWTKETFSLGSTSAVLVTPTGSYEDQEVWDTLKQYGVETKLVPKWLPDGYLFENILVQEQPAKTKFFITYITDGTELTIAITMLSKASTRVYEKDENEVTVYTLHGIDHYIQKNIDQTDIVWFNGNYECAIHGNFSVEDAELMIDSIY